MLEDLIGRYEESERKTEENSSKSAELREQWICDKTYGQIRKRKDLEEEDDNSKEKKASFDMKNFFREKMDQDSEMKREELEASRPINSHASGVRLTHSTRATENHAQSWKSHGYSVN